MMTIYYEWAEATASHDSNNGIPLEETYRVEHNENRRMTIAWIQTAT